MQNSYNLPSSPHINKVPASNALLWPKVPTLQQQLSRQPEDKVDFSKPFSVDYIAGQGSPYKVYSRNNQPMVSSLLDRANTGRTLRGDRLNEFHTEKEMLLAVRTLTRLFNTNLNAIHRIIGILLPGTLVNIPKIEERAATNAVLASHFKSENFPERQIIRILTQFVQMAESHFEGLYHSLAQIQRKVDQVKGAAQLAPLYNPPQPDGLIAAALLQRKMDHSSRSHRYFRFIPHNDISSEPRGVQMMTSAGDYLITNMAYLHDWMERLQKQLGVPDLPEAEKPRNKDYHRQLQKISEEAKNKSVNLQDENVVDGCLLEMLKPLTHIVADNVECLQKRLSGPLGVKIWHLMKR